MAHPITYDVPPTRTEQSAEEEAQELIETMHEHGVLRVLNGLFGQFPAVAEIAADGLDTDGGRNALGTLMVLLKGLGTTDPDGLQALLDEASEGLQEAGRSFEQEPPGVFNLARQLGDPDVQRGLRAGLILLKALGRGLREQDLPGHGIVSVDR